MRSKMFSQIDRYNIQYKSAQAKRQMKPRHLGSDSARNAPTDSTLPQFAFAADSGSH